MITYCFGVNLAIELPHI
uniref:Uncharacterized protein n=1 Tax=Lepeophtheirus salmonis TaxID=72036 RepID=A0A0K2V422_LEPSM